MKICRWMKDREYRHIQYLINLSGIDILYIYNNHTVYTIYSYLSQCYLLTTPDGATAKNTAERHVVEKGFKILEQRYENLL